MRSILTLVAGMVLAGCAGLAGPEVDLESEWTFKVGDDAAWAASDFDDSDWKPIEVDVPWEKAGFPDLDGYAWYRCRITVPATLREALSKRGANFLILDLGAIDDVDETFWNGKKIGSTGAVAPDYKTAWNQPRAYSIPAYRIDWGGENVIAVRVYDGDGDGGMYGGPSVLRVPAFDELIDFNVRPDSANGVFPRGGPVTVTATVENRSQVSGRATIECVWGTDSIVDKTVLKKEKREVALAAGSVVSESFSYAPAEPGIYPVSVKLKMGDNGENRERVVVGYAVDEIRGKPAREHDFDAFWKARFEEFRAIDPEYKIEKRQDKSTEKVDTYLVEMKSYRGVRVRGWFTVPKAKGRYPALVTVMGYGGNNQPATWRENMAVMALNIRGQGNSRQDVDAKGGEYMYIDLTDDPADYVYVGAYLDCVRAVDFLFTRSEVDHERIGIMGGSQGGGLSMAAAALDPRIRACAADVAWLCDWPGYAETAPWALDNFPKLLKDRKDLTVDGIMRVLSYVDNVNLADRIRCPVIASIGMLDITCPPRTTLAAFNLIKSPKRMYFYPFGGHGGGGSVHSKRKEEWMKEMLGVKE